jgi:hypothetical protein
VSSPSPNPSNTPPSTKASPPRRLGSFAQAGVEHDRSERTMRNYHRRKYFQAYRVPGVPGVLLDLDEVAAAMRLLAQQHRYGSYGGGEVVDLPPQVIISNDRLGQNREPQS